VTTIASGPEPSSGSASATFTFSSEVSGVTFRCSIDGAPLTICSSPKTYTGLEPGEHTFEVHATMPHLLADPEPALHEWTVLDVTDPETTILTGPPASTTLTEAEFTFSSNEIEAEFECSLDNAAFESCSSPEQISGLAVGDHTLRVRAVDAGGNADETPASRTWTVRDATPPETDITSQPAASTTSTSASFAFTSSETGSTFQCALDSGAFAACTSPRAYSGLSTGSHTFRVRAIDAAANPDPTPDTYTWTIDTAAPQTTIASSPPASTQATTASFTFTASETGSTFECSLDNAAFAACTSPRALSSLAPGAHSFRVRARDAAGNLDGSPAAHNWTITTGCAAPAQTLGANIDSWILQDSAAQNYGTDSVLKVDTKSNANARAVVRFNLPAVPAGCQITSAKLRLYASSYKTGRTLQALRLGAAWTESTIRWNNQPATTGTAVTTASGSGYREWTVTQHVLDMYTSANNGWLIRDQTENGGGLDQGFHSREKGSDNPPRLVITFG
jgi:large repetitive protein